MKTFNSTSIILNMPNRGKHIRLGLTLAGVVTAVICTLTFLHDPYSSGELRLPSGSVSTDLSIELKDIANVTILWPGSH